MNINFSENEFRDYLYENHKDSITQLIKGLKTPITWKNKGFPPISFLLQKKAEENINRIIRTLDEMELISKEIPLDKTNDSTTRVDLLGNSHVSGLTIIELKKSKQTERQAFTELLAYANHFCSIFPGLKESTITSILIAPMQTRTVRDAYVQELVTNNKNILALVPSDENGEISLSVYYPDSSYYQWFENNLLDDRSMLTVVLSFPELKGWIDTDIKSKGEMPGYSVTALNTIANSISHKLESHDFHSLVYASQKWGEISEMLPYPNSIFVVAINPFTSFRTSISNDSIYGQSLEGRIKEVRSIYEKINETDKNSWLNDLESSFHDNLIRIVSQEFESCFKCDDKKIVSYEISLPLWHHIKNSMIDSVFTYNLDVYLTGLLREVYKTYINHVYDTEEECIFYGNDIPKYSYQTYRSFLPVWEIFRGLGYGEEKA